MPEKEFETKSTKPVSKVITPKMKRQYFYPAPAGKGRRWKIAAGASPMIGIVI